MDLAPFMAALEKLGMFAIAGYLVWNLVQQQRDANGMWRTFAENMTRSVDKLIDVLERIETKHDK